LHEVTQVCTRLGILSQGKVHYQNTMAAALAVQPHVRIQVNRDLGRMRSLLQSIHPDLQVDGDTLILRNEAMALRPQVLAILINTGYDILHLEQKRTTLAEIYDKAVK
jgi:ABC-type multidrug transport system ATPase subunit